jgi:alpha-beta hydrolase superfamily lysophospholipase
LDYQSVAIPGRDGIILSGWIIPAESSDTVAVLFHGYSSEKSGLLHEAALFHDLGCDVVLVDFPGHGDSPGNRTSLGLEEARDVAAVYDWVRTTRPDHRIVLYGHSMGGAAVMRALATMDIEPEAAVVEAVFDTLLQAVRFRFELLSAPSFPAAEILLFWGSVQLGVNGFDHDVVDYARDVRIPVLIIHGEQDRRADWKGAKRVFDGLVRAQRVFADTGGRPCECMPQRHGAMEENGGVVYERLMREE